MQWVIYAATNQCQGKCSPVKQEYTRSSTGFCLYIDEISNCIEKLGGSGSCLAGVVIPILLYANDILLIPADTIILDDERTWIGPITTLGRKIAQYKELSLHAS